MKKYLLFLFAMLYGHVGAWASAVNIGSTSSTYEVTTTANNKKVLTINIATANDLTTSGWLADNNFGSSAPDDFKSADCVVIIGTIGAIDAPKIQLFSYTLLNLYNATLDGSLTGKDVYVHNPSAGVIVPNGKTAAQWLEGNDNPYVYKALFSIDTSSSTVTADIYMGDNNFATIMTDDKNSYDFFDGKTTLTIKGLSKNGSTYIENGVSLTQDIIDGINNANGDFTTINLENATANNLSMTVSNTNVTTLNLSGLTLNGETNLNIGGANKTSMAVTSINLQDVKVKTVDVTNLTTLQNINLDGASVTSVNFTRSGGDYNNLFVIVENQAMVDKLIPSAETMWGTANVENHVSKPAVVYSSTDMYLHNGKTANDGDNYVYWYQGDTDSQGFATLNAKGAISGTLLSDGYIKNKTFVKVTVSGYLSKLELAELSNINTQILDLSELDLTHSGSCSIADLSEQFCKANWDLNSNVKFVILPEGATREQIISADKVSGLKNIYSIVSFEHDGSNFDFTAYNKERGTLAAALVAGGKGAINSYMTYDNHSCYTPEMTNNRTKKATISGKINAYDLVSSPSSNGLDSKLDANGHLTYNKTYANESSLTDDRVNIGTRSVYGAFAGSNPGPETLDLKYAEIEGPTYINDIKVSSLVNGIGTLKYLIIPENETVKETPSFFILHNTVKEICIPSNIETIRTHFAPSVDHLWTTGYKVGQSGGDPTELTYDNGAYESNVAEPAYGYTDLTFSASSLYPYGTYTFSSNLKMIETGAFANTNPCVKDVYVLAKTAPECHVDAFNTKMYVGNGGYSPSIVGGVITRDSYVNGNQWITMLHYPRECTSPQVQRYTDPTRQYTIASNEVDGKGGVLYYPSQGEFIAAYGQGTTGYLWNAWDRTYEWGMLKSTANITSAWSVENQRLGNQYFLANPDLVNYPGNTKYTCTSFYDVTGDGQLSQPAGLVPYYDVRWDERTLSDKGAGIQLYPEIEESNTTEYRYVSASQEDFNNGITLYTQNSSGSYEQYGGSTFDNGTSYYKRIQTQQTDANGLPVFQSCNNGSYVQDTRYVEAEDGAYVLNSSVSGYETTNQSIDGIETYYSDQGTTSAMPKVAYDFYYQNGMRTDFSNAVYQPQRVNGELITTYYKDEGGTKVQSEMQFSSIKYHSPSLSHQTVYSAAWNLQFGVSHYYSDNKGETEVTPTISLNSGTLYYYDDSDDQYHQTSTFIRGQGKYYVEYNESPGKYLPVNDSYPQVSFGGAQYYYANGEEDVTTYTSTDVWIPSITTYYSDENGTVYYSGDAAGTWPGGAFNAAYYYVTGTSPNIISAQNTDYNAATTYYSDAAGTTVATTVTFDQSYYYPVYSNSYTAYNESTDAGKTRYNPETYYRAAVDGDGEAQRYCPVMEDKEFNVVTKLNDYRGWHQFVLNAYSTGTNIPLQPSRSYQTDNDWWTICLPYDLTYNEVMLFYGNVNATGQLQDSNVPIVCLLSNVVRDLENKSIRLNFSSNLMEHKATKVDGEWIVSDDAPNHLKQAESGTDPDIIIHAGVPYAIKPTFEANATRQFDVYNRENINAAISEGRITANSTDYPGLYAKLKAAEDIAGEAFRQLQEDNLYTVPCLIPVDQATNDNVVDNTEITYDGKKYYRSNAFDYTFVGALQQNIIPPFSYFLGYKNKSLFVYADYDTAEFETNKTLTTPDYRNVFKWTNNACIICPNLLSSSCKESQKGTNNKYNLMKGSHNGLITQATTSAPARWVFFNSSANIGGMYVLADDRFADNSSSRGILALGDEINFGNDMEYNVTNGIESLETDNANKGHNAMNKVYSLNGQYMGSSKQGLKKGIYIIGGRKHIVK